MPLYFSYDTIYLYLDDFLNFNDLAPSSVDLIVTSPPYNVGMEYESYDDKVSYGDYLGFLERALAKCYELLKPDGRAIFNIPLDNNKGKRECLLADFILIARQVGFKYHGTIIWAKGNISRRSAWGSWLSASAPAITPPVEVLPIIYKESWKKQKKGISDIGKDEFIQWTLGLWNFPGEQRDLHPAPFPLELPKRCIKLFSYVGDVVLDPFVGSGTTLIAAYKLGRIGIGVEISEKYCKIAVERITKELFINQQPKLLSGE